MASGMPSRREQIRPADGALRVTDSQVRPGGHRPKDEQLQRLSLR